MTDDNDLTDYCEPRLPVLSQLAGLWLWLCLSCAWPALALAVPDCLCWRPGNARRVLVARKVYGHLAVIKAEKENKDKCLKERNERKKEISSSTLEMKVNTLRMRNVRRAIC